MDWQKWLTPDGVKTIIELVIVAMSAVTAVLALLGQKDKAAKLEEAKDTLAAKEETIANATKTAVAIVQGVEKFRDNATPEASAELKKQIMDVTQAMGVEHIVQPLVKAATEGTGSALAALAQPNPAPAVPTAPNPPNA